jgi:hypothetical protein
VVLNFDHNGASMQLPRLELAIVALEIITPH